MRAGFCSVCSSNVYLDDGGNCVKGHPAANISNSYDVPDVEIGAPAAASPAETTDSIQEPQVPIFKHKWFLPGVMLLVGILIGGSMGSPSTDYEGEIASLTAENAELESKARAMAAERNSLKSELRRSRRIDEAAAEARASAQAASEAPKGPTEPVDETVLNPQNSKELKAVLQADNPGDSEVTAFIEKYSGRTIEFDGYTWDWVDGGNTNIYVGDVKNADVSSSGPTFRVEGFQMPGSASLPARKNVHATATVDGWDADHEFFRVTLISLEAR